MVTNGTSREPDGTADNDIGAPGYGVDYRLIDGVAVIELQRPAARNALDLTMKSELLAALHWLRSDGHVVRAVLITAAGENFCVGQDLKEHARALEQDPSTAFTTLEEHYNQFVKALHALPQPIVAAVEGTCVGAGLGLALCADLRVVADTATFATAFIGIGLAPDTGMSRALVRLLGPSRAAALLLLGERFGAEDAARWGLAHHVVPQGHAAAAGLELARRLAAGPTAAYREVKLLIRTASTADLDDVLEREFLAQQRLGMTDDHRAAVQAFLARKDPVFHGR